MNPLPLVAAGTSRLWDPTILGVLVVLAGIGLFYGSVYLLLTTNLGARLGFLIAASAVTGFLVLLALLWSTTATPLESPKGRIAEWKVENVVTSLSKSKVATVRTIRQQGDQATSDQLASIKPGIDAALVKPAAVAGETPTAGTFAEFSNASDYLTVADSPELAAYVVGGGTKNVFWHRARYAAVEICPKRQVQVSLNAPPPAPTCEPGAGTKWVVLVYDFGSLRQPPVVFLGAFIVLFAIALLGLHWREKDMRAAEHEQAEAAGTPEPVNA